MVSFVCDRQAREGVGQWTGRAGCSSKVLLRADAPAFCQAFVTLTFVTLT